MDEVNYARIAKAIEYIQENFKRQPTLDEIAEKVHLSPFHFQRLFTEWAGVSPKKFLQYISVEYAKQLLKASGNSLSETAFKTGLSGTGRLHDLFVHIEGMTPGEYKNGGATLHIDYSFAESPFGRIIIASTEKGICHVAFDDDKTNALEDLKKHFPNAEFSETASSFHHSALAIFGKDWNEVSQIRLHLKGTEFQIKVWETLLKIPTGKLSTYGQIAQQIGNVNASRAVGTAIGSNPVAFIIPCHRVIQSSGIIGGYMWGTSRKTAIIGWEAACTSTPEQQLDLIL